MFFPLQFLQKAQKSEIEESFNNASEVVSSFKTATNVMTQNKFPSFDVHLAEQKTDLNLSTSRNENLNSFRKPSLQENRIQPLPGKKQQRIVFVDTEFGTCFVVFEQNGEKKLDNNLAEELRGRILEAVKKVVSEFKRTVENNDEQTEEESLPEDDYYYYKEMQQDVNGHWKNERDDPRPIKSLLDEKLDPRPIKSHISGKIE